MFTLLLVLLILDGLLLTLVVLLQAGKGGGLAAMGGGAGTESFLGGRQAANLLTRTSWITGGVFLLLSLVLSVMSSRRFTPEPLLRQEFQTAPALPAPGAGVPGIETAPEGASPEAAPAPAPQ